MFPAVIYFLDYGIPRSLIFPFFGRGSSILVDVGVGVLYVGITTRGVGSNRGRVGIYCHYPKETEWVEVGTNRDRWGLDSWESWYGGGGGWPPEMILVLIPGEEYSSYEVY